VLRRLREYQEEMGLLKEDIKHDLVIEELEDGVDIDPSHVVRGTCEDAD
jgi:hypothetical protein